MKNITFLIVILYIYGYPIKVSVYKTGWFPRESVRYPLIGLSSILITCIEAIVCYIRSIYFSNYIKYEIQIYCKLTF